MDRIVKASLRSSMLLLWLVTAATAQEIGGIRGVVYDQDFDVPLPGVQILISETGQTATTNEEGTYVFGEVTPNTYTLIFSKPGFTRQFTPNVVVSAGQMTDVNASMPGEFTEMEEVVVQDLEFNSEFGLLQIRAEAPSLLDSISADLMSQAGSSNAADALRLVAGATVEDGKYAVVRGLPDRYVNSQLNSVRLPTADVDKRAVQLDQFPAALVESIQVSKTFTPDQQGDASGGAVNLVLKGIPDERVLKVKGGVEYNSQVKFRDDFLTCDGGGVDFFGIDDGGRDIPRNNNFGGTMGVSEDDAPLIYSGSVTAGGKRELDNGVLVGGLISMYYKHDASYYEGGENNVYAAQLDGNRYILEPFIREEFTSLFDVTEGVEEVKWGAMGSVGAEIDNHALSLLYMTTQVTQDEASLLEDTRGANYRDELGHRGSVSPQ